jgi:predicted dinucleotide-binding enzyme
MARSRRRAANAVPSRLERLSSVTAVNPLDSGRLAEQRLTVFVTADDADAKRTTMDLVTSIGFESMRPLANAIANRL